MDTLKQKLNALIEELSEDKRTAIKNRLDDLASVYPFNEYEYIISSLMGFGKITLDDYYMIRDEYISRNIYLYILRLPHREVLEKGGHKVNLCPLSQIL